MQEFSCKFFKMFKNAFFPDHLWMTASALKQLLALYFPIIYSWQLSSSEKSLVGKNVHPYISKILQISFTQVFFFFNFFFIYLFTLTNACVIRVGCAKRMLYSEQPTVLFAWKYLNILWFMKHNKSYERCMFNQIQLNETNICNVLFTYSARASFEFPYFNQFLKFLQRFTVFNILRYHGPYLGS